jgi:hypothetical protein
LADVEAPADVVVQAVEVAPVVVAAVRAPTSQPKQTTRKKTSKSRA